MLKRPPYAPIRPGIFGTLLTRVLGREGLGGLPSLSADQYLLDWDNFVMGRSGGISISDGVTLWQRRRDRPEPDFFMYESQVKMSFDRLRWGYNAPRMHDEALTVVNTGDGDAYRVVVKPVGCRVRGIALDPRDQRGFQTFIVVPRLTPGQDFMLLVWNDEGKKPDQRVFSIEWLSSPTRRRHIMTKTIRRDELLDGYPGEA